VAYPQAWLRRNEQGQIIGSFSQVRLSRDGSPTRIPLVPLGTFYLQVPDPEHPGQYKVAPVDIKREYLEEMLRHFQEGHPNNPQTGAPVNELADHTRNEAGAFGWIRDIELDADGLWGMYHPTPLGLKPEIVEALPFVSPRFVVGEGVDPVWGVGNALLSGALTDSPQFTGQPQMVLASAQPPSVAQAEPEEATAASAATDTPNEGEMATMPEDIQAQIDAAIAAAKATWEQEQAEVLAAAETEKAGLLAQITELTEKAGDYDKLQKQVEVLLAESEATKAQARLDAAMREFESVRIPVGTKLPDGTVQTDLRAIAPEAIQVAAAFKVDPANAENANAYWTLVQANNGSLPTVPAPGADKPALHVAASVPADIAGMTEEQKLAAAVAAGEVIPGTEDHSAILGHMQAGLTFSAARRKLALATAGLPG